MFTYLYPRLLTILNQLLSSIVSCSVQGVRTFEYKWQNPTGLALRGMGALSLSSLILPVAFHASIRKWFYTVLLGGK